MLATDRNDASFFQILFGNFSFLGDPKLSSDEFEGTDTYVKQFRQPEVEPRAVGSLKLSDLLRLHAAKCPPGETLSKMYSKKEKAVSEEERG